MTTSHNVIVIGTAHPHVMGTAALVREMSDAQIVGVWDNDADRLADACKALEAPPFNTLDDALAADPALALVGAVASERPDLICMLLAAGIPIWADKPVAVTHDGLSQIMHAANGCATPLSAGLSYRGDPLVLAAKGAIEQGRIGKLVRSMACGPHKLRPEIRPDWHWTRDNGGILIDIGSHHADIGCWFHDAEPKTITAMHANFTQPDHPAFQDFGQAQVRFDDGSMAHFEVDWLNPDSIEHFGDTRFWFLGTTGKIELRLGDEVSARIWTSDALEDLTPADEDAHAWEIRLLRDLCNGRQGDIPKDDIFRATRVTLEAFDSAEHDSKALPYFK